MYATDSPSACSSSFYHPLATHLIMPTGKIILMICAPPKVNFLYLMHITDTMDHMIKGYLQDKLG